MTPDGQRVPPANDAAFARHATREYERGACTDDDDDVLPMPPALPVPPPGDEGVGDSARPLRCSTIVVHSE